MHGHFACGLYSKVYTRLMSRSTNEKLQTPQRYELWYSSKEGHSFFPETNETARKLLSADSKLVTVIVADSWEDAQTKKHDYLGLEPRLGCHWNLLTFDNREWWH